MQSGTAVMTAGLVMGVMLIPFVSPRCPTTSSTPCRRRCATVPTDWARRKSETIKPGRACPPRCPGIVGAILLAASARDRRDDDRGAWRRGGRAAVSMNPFDAMTTVTAKIVSQLTGDSDFRLARGAGGLCPWHDALRHHAGAEYLCPLHRAQIPGAVRMTDATMQRDTRQPKTLARLRRIDARTRQPQRGPKARFKAYGLAAVSVWVCWLSGGSGFCQHPRQRAFSCVPPRPMSASRWNCRLNGWTPKSNRSTRPKWPADHDLRPTCRSCAIVLHSNTCSRTRGSGYSRHDRARTGTRCCPKIGACDRSVTWYLANPDLVGQTH